MESGATLTPDERELIGLKAQFIMGPTALMMDVMWNGNFSGEELARFCQKTPNGEALWAHFKAYRQRAANRGIRGYGYLEYAKEILTENP